MSFMQKSGAALPNEAVPGTQRRPVWQSFVLVLAMFAALCCIDTAVANESLMYSFEDGALELFFPNGGGVTLTDSAVGATDGAHSMKMEVVQGATFVGALNQLLAVQIADPPGLDLVSFDLTLTEPFAGTGFVNAGITIFGMSQIDYPGGPLFGLQAQFIGNEARIGALPAGTHKIYMELSSATHPLTFATHQSFNDIFGVEGSGPNDLIPTGFQIYINKSNTAPWTGYIDNIQAVTYDPDFNNDNSVNGPDVPVFQSAFGVNANADADCDMDTDGNDILIWQRRLGSTFGIASAVPEPSAALLAAMGFWAWRRAGRFVGFCRSNLGS